LFHDDEYASASVESHRHHAFVSREPGMQRAAGHRFERGGIGERAASVWCVRVDHVEIAARRDDDRSGDTGPEPSIRDFHWSDRFLIGVAAQKPNSSMAVMLR
jgi:hypothetical protein